MISKPEARRAKTHSRVCKCPWQCGTQGWRSRPSGGGWCHWALAGAGACAAAWGRVGRLHEFHIYPASRTVSATTAASVPTTEHDRTNPALFLQKRRQFCHHPHLDSNTYAFICLWNTKEDEECENDSIWWCQMWDVWICANINGLRNGKGRLKYIIYSSSCWFCPYRGCQAH